MFWVNSDQKEGKVLGHSKNPATLNTLTERRCENPFFFVTVTKMLLRIIFPAPVWVLHGSAMAVVLVDRPLTLLLQFGPQHCYKRVEELCTHDPSSAILCSDLVAGADME